MREAAPQLRMSHVPARRSIADADLMSVLEERLTTLVERHREALKVIEELRAQLSDERASASALARQLQRRDADREVLGVRVRGLLERIARVESALAERAIDASSDEG